MAKDDYFVIAYRILSYLYACFKAGEKAEKAMFDSSALGINNGYWVNVIESLYREGYIMGVAFPSAIGDFPAVVIHNIKITQKGIEFLEDNGKMKKAAEVLKTIKDIVPGF